MAYALPTRLQTSGSQRNERHKVGDVLDIDEEVIGLAELARALPERCHTVPEAAKRAKRREMPVPLRLRIEERPCVVILEVKEDGKGTEDRWGEQQPGQMPDARPGHDCEPDNDGDTDRPRQRGRPRRGGCPGPVPALGEEERPDRERKEERLRIDGAKEYGHREEAEVEHGSRCAARADSRQR